MIKLQEQHSSEFILNHPPKIERTIMSDDNNFELTHMEVMEVEIISFLAVNGDKCDIYEILKGIEDFEKRERFYVSELRIVLKKMEIAGLIDIMTGNHTTKDKYGFRPIVQIVTKV